MPARSSPASRTAFTRPSPFSTTTASPERARAHPREGHRRGRRHDYRSFGLFFRAQAAVNSRTLAAARVAYKALTAPLDPVNEGSFRALESDHPRGQHHDGALSGADGGLEHLRSDGRRDHRHLAREGDARQDPGGAPRAARRIGGVLRRASGIEASLRGAEHRGRRLGRPSVRGRRVGHGFGLSGRRAQTARSRASR